MKYNWKRSMSSLEISKLMAKILFNLKSCARPDNNSLSSSDISKFPEYNNLINIMIVSGLYFEGKVNVKISSSHHHHLLLLACCYLLR